MILVRIAERVSLIGPRFSREKIGAATFVGRRYSPGERKRKLGRRINQDKLLAKIAALTGTDQTELKEAAKKSNLYSFDETVMEMQSVINFYKTRIQPKPPQKKMGESAVAFAKREREFEQAYQEWRIKKCDECGWDFAYAYKYEGVKYCSLDCLDDALRKIGLSVTPGRDLMKRWGLFHPAIVPSSALGNLRELYPTSFSQSDVPEESDHPSPQNMSPLHSLSSPPHASLPENDTDQTQDNQSNTA